jgi:hypothetical protein
MRRCDSFDKGTLGESQGRKASGLRVIPRAAGPPTRVLFRSRSPRWLAFPTYCFRVFGIRTIFAGDKYDCSQTSQYRTLPASRKQWKHRVHDQQHSRIDPTNGSGCSHRRTDPATTIRSLRRPASASIVSWRRLQSTASNSLEHTNSRDERLAAQSLRRVWAPASDSVPPAWRAGC